MSVVGVFELLLLDMASVQDPERKAGAHNRNAIKIISTQLEYAISKYLRNTEDDRQGHLRRSDRGLAHRIVVTLRTLVDGAGLSGSGHDSSDTSMLWDN